MIRKLFTGVAASAVVAAFVVAPSVPVTAVESAASPTVQPAVDMKATPIAMLDAIPILQRYYEGFTKSAFPGSSAKRGKCTLRQWAMLTHAKAPKGKKLVVRNCYAKNGYWVPEFVKKQKITKGRLVAANLMVPSLEAWRSGAWTWTDAQRAKFAKDVKFQYSYLVTTKKLAKSRQAKDPSYWMPAKSKCQYAIDWVAVKYKWNLAVDPEEHAVLQKAMANCKKASKNLAGVTQSTSTPDLYVPPSTELIGRTIDTSMFGMNVNVGYSTPTVTYGTLRLWDGFEWYRNEPARGQFSWDHLDLAMTEANRANAQIMMTLAGTPAWAVSNPAATSWETQSIPPNNFNDFYGYVDAVSKRYAGRIKMYQIWNEANLLTFWQGTPQQMAEITRRSYEIIKANDPNAIVLAPSTTVRLASQFGEFFPQYLKALGEQGWPVDAFSVHSYPPSTGGTIERDAGLALFRLFLKQAGAPQKPVYETEINFGLAGPGPNYPDVDYSATEQQDLVVRAYIDSLRNALVSTEWFQWQRGDKDLLGVQMYAGAPATVAWTEMVNTLVGSVYNGCTDKGTYSTCFFTASNGSKFEIWLAISGSVDIALPAGATACRFGGGCSQQSTVTVGSAPILVRQ